MIDRKRKLSLERIRRESRFITRLLSHWKPYLDAKTILLYASLKREVQVMELMERALAAGKRVCLPVCDLRRSGMLAYVVKSSKDLVVGPYGITQPKCIAGRRMAIKKLDLLLIPGLAFDKKGNRLGRGKGYYDEFLSHCNGKALKVGLALEVQIVPKVPVEKHDVAMDFVVHPRGILRCKKRN